MSAGTAPAGTDLFAQLSTTLVPRGTAPLVRLSMRSAAYFDADFVQRAVAEARTRCAQAAAGIDKLSLLEQLAVHLLCDSADIRPPLRSE
tara:strand:- start:3523 stop:3792 length:270 start_codon:yes stop_codon:yes gene_type:complete